MEGKEIGESPKPATLLQTTNYEQYINRHADYRHRRINPEPID
jgi:hypothetical protein